MGVVVPVEELEKKPLHNAVALMDLNEAIEKNGEIPDCAIRLAVTVHGDESEEAILRIKDLNPVMILFQPLPSLSGLHAGRRFFRLLQENQIENSVVHLFQTAAQDTDTLALEIGTRIGSLLTDGNGDGVAVEQIGDLMPFSVDFLRSTSFSMLQGCRMRNIKTEFVSCPSCGRTLFDLQETTAAITEATGHLPGVTIAVMGCIVNGPGEMADADFGYVGTVPGKVDLYYGKEVVKKGIKNEDAVGELVELIKEYDMWQDKPVEEEGEKEEAMIMV